MPLSRHGSRYVRSYGFCACEPAEPARCGRGGRPIKVLRALRNHFSKSLIFLHHRPQNILSKYNAVRQNFELGHTSYRTWHPCRAVAYYIKSVKRSYSIILYPVMLILPYGYNKIPCIVYTLHIIELILRLCDVTWLHWIMWSFMPMRRTLCMPRLPSHRSQNMYFAARTKNAISKVKN